jgi:CDGSH-type Zn-finger protein
MTLTITIRKNGPYVVAPDDVDKVQLIDHEGNVIPPRSAPGKPMSLCRCGGSAVKPFCDGTHSKIGFVGAEAARAAYDAATNPPPVSATMEFPISGLPSSTSPASPASSAPASPAAPPSSSDAHPFATQEGPVAQGDGAEAGTLPPANPER